MMGMKTGHGIAVLVGFIWLFWRMIDGGGEARPVAMEDIARGDGEGDRGIGSNGTCIVSYRDRQYSRNASYATVLCYQILLS
jgi:hypothetical protein